MDKKVITYSMVEQVIFLFKTKNILNLDQVEIILRQVRDKMDVGQLNRLQSKK